MIVAARDLKLRTVSGDLPIPIRVFSPTFEKDGVWFCRYEIAWPDKKSEMSIGGFDSTQALVHALQTIGAEIYSSNYHKSGNLLWDAPGNGYGFPVAPTLRDLLQGDDLKYL
jgi:hypothetical protein